ncbi:MAG: hypothetical protein GYA15_15865 [Leptolinea sp.]|jgi:PadR family transcriptional regulator PadR|nr:hypothetical protein [Leptolinea sp.]
MPRHGRGWAMGHDRADASRHSPITGLLLEPALLILINEKPRHGYLLLTEIISLGLSTVHPSVVYRILRDMEMLNWIQSEWEPDETQGPPRRIYRVTELGRQVVNNWVIEFEKIQELLNTLRTKTESTEI